MGTVVSFPVSKAAELRMYGDYTHAPCKASWRVQGRLPLAYWLFGYLFPLQRFYSVGIKEFHLDFSGICQGTLLALTGETEEEL